MTIGISAAEKKANAESFRRNTNNVTVMTRSENPWTDYDLCRELCYSNRQYSASTLKNTKDIIYLFIRYCNSNYIFEPTKLDVQLFITCAFENGVAKNTILNSYINGLIRYGYICHKAGLINILDGCDRKYLLANVTKNDAFIANKKINKKEEIRYKAAVAHVKEGICAEEVAKQYGVSVGSIYNWSKQYKLGSLEIPKSKEHKDKILWIRLSHDEFSCVKGCADYYDISTSELIRRLIKAQADILEM